MSSTPPQNLFEQFRRPPRAFSPVPTWWWSGERVEVKRLRWQMERYAEGGVYNLIVLNLAAAGPMHGCDADDPPFFSEAWWCTFLAACAEAERLGMHIWFYDQIGFSGANFQGRLVMHHPDWAGQALERVPLEAEPPPRARPLARLRAHLACTVERGFDYLNPDACSALLDTIHGEFERRAGHYLGNVIAGSFQDELPNVPMWSRGFADAFRARTGYSILDRLDALWMGDDPDAARVRLDYHRVRAILAEEAFFKPLAAWHEEHRLLCGCDQQSPARAASPVGSTEQYADYARTHRWYSAPGSDHDGHAKLHSSLAHLYGRPRVWLEAFHSTGWGGTLEETFDWLLPWLRAGVTLYAPHADYYSTRGGWWEWAAPSTCWRQPYWKHYPLFADAIARLCWLLSRGHHVCDIAIVFPTSTVQAGLALDGSTPEARRAQETWNELTGSMIWQRFQPGLLDQWNRDYDALDEDSIARAVVRDGRLAIGGESFSTVILPALTELPDAAAQRLKEFAAAGGRLLAIHAAPDSLAEHARVVGGSADIETHITAQPAHVEASVPLLHRRVDELHVVLVTACRGMATVVHPPPGEWWARRGYDFSPDRYATSQEVLIRDTGVAPFLLDPFSGERRAVSWRRTGGGTIATVPFDTGPAQVLAWSGARGTSEPPPKLQRLQNVPATFSNEWKSELVPTLDNRHGDFTMPPTTESFPVQTWSLRHRVESEPGQGARENWHIAPPRDQADEVIASFGRRGWQSGPLPLGGLEAADPREVVYSLSRGLHKDPVHNETLGPKGHIAEDFIHFGITLPGQGVRFHTQVRMERPTRTHLAIGSAGGKRAWINGNCVTEDSSGFLWLAPVELRAGLNEIAWEVAPEEPVNLRAYWALVDDPDAFARPEWMTAPGEPRADTQIRFATEWTVRGDVSGARLHVGCDAPCRLLIDGREVGRQGGFDPYKIGMRVDRYEAGPLTAGEHRVELEVLDVGQRVTLLVDGLTDGGERLLSDARWQVAREHGGMRPVRLHRIPFKEIGWAHLWRRPHPLPGASWLEGPQPEGVVRAIRPESPAPNSAMQAEWLWWKLPPGANSMQVPTSAPCRFWMNGRELTRDAGGSVKLPDAARPGRRWIAARFEPTPGRHGGGLVDGPIIYRTGAGWITTGDWTEQGLACHSGGVVYRQNVTLAAQPARQTWLDLGRVRGTAEVRVNGEPAGARFLAPYRFAVGSLLRAGANEIEVTVFNTLAPWLEAHSPTRNIWAGTCAGGLFGPISLKEIHDA
ncbi:MAG TPA: hypothetical protein PKE12_11310 [Kiritimatiellia bacterium]|nr:hypothetical protein [Kiritimatiellia bacterium]